MSHEVRHPELENQHCLNINRLPARATIIPAGKTEVYYRNKAESNRLQTLNGDWKFNYQQDDCLSDFFLTNYDDSAWDRIDVPSMWQYRGYGKPAYPNVRYPIPFHPPYVCCENPVGYYRRSFNISKKTPRTILHFGGVDNAFYIYLNGTFVGFSKGSRIPAEFDVSALVLEGENLVAVKVFTYSDATYLENQDMLLASGIFRDVYLLHLDEVSLWDYRVTTTENSFSISVMLDFHDEPGWTFRMLLDGQTIECNAAPQLSHTFFLQQPRLWNAEQPNLYDLTLEVLRDGKVTEIHSKRVGIMHTRCDGLRFLVNGSPVTIKGINRHENDCSNGRAITVELIECELRMIKDNHINAIRCSHYTNNPAFYEIAAELGIYVMDEADLETHGCEVTDDQGYLSKQSEWFDAYFDRVSRMLEINKNEPCIFIWSMGNECGSGENIDRCLQYTRSFDPTKAVSYSQVYPDQKLCPAFADFCYIGYPSVEKIREYDEAKKPTVLIEYAHAMGNSPGFLQGYQDNIYALDHICGGFAWEFKSHGFRTVDENGKDTFLYGGDFDDHEHYHWYNFCLDGYLTSNGTPKPSWYELGEVYAPILVRLDGGVKLINTNDFRPADYLAVRWEVTEDYNVLRFGEEQLSPIPPRGSAMLAGDFSIASPKPGAKYYLNLTFQEDRRSISKKQLELPVSLPAQPFHAPCFHASIQDDASSLVVCGDSFEISFTDGVLCRYAVGENVILNSPMQFSFYRAPTDNDGIIAPERWFHTWFHRHAREWSETFLCGMRFRCQRYHYEAHKDYLLVKALGTVISSYEYLGFEMQIEYHIFAGGEILLDLKGKPFGKMPSSLPRIGVCFNLSSAMKDVSWYGCGPGQNYCDMKAYTPVGLYTSTVEKLNFTFDVPQETGNHEETRFVRVGGPKGLSIIGCDHFSFSYHNFSLEALDKAKHLNDLVKADKNVLYIDGWMRGLGSRSCGPDPESRFELRPQAFELAFVLKCMSDDCEALSLARSDFGVRSNKLGEEYLFISAGKEAETADCQE